MLLVSLVVKVLLESIGRSGTVDPETGIPNGVGLARRLQTSHKADAEQSMLIVAAVVLAGVDDARKALGYRVGTELLRRVVEDLGQVVSPNTLIARVEGDELVVVQTVKVTNDASRTMRTKTRTAPLPRGPARRQIGWPMNWCRR